MNPEVRHGIDARLRGRRETCHDVMGPLFMVWRCATDLTTPPSLIEL